MGVRLAERRDIPLLVEMARAFHGQSPYADLPFNSVAIMDSLRNMIHLPNFVILMTDTAAIGGFVVTDLRVNTTVAQEEFWYSQGGRDGVRLIKAFMKWGKSKSATHLSMVSLPDSPAVCGFYKRVGLSPVEVRHFGRLM